jgi:hypothetical protein
MPTPPRPDAPQARVVDDVGEALDAVGRGRAVVLVADTASAPEAVTGLGSPGSPGRLAVFVGDPSDPADRELAGVMADELFG